MSKNAEMRQKYQVDFTKSGKELEAGNIENLPLPISEMEKIDKDSKYVVKYFGGGLTSEVMKLKINDKFYTLKKKRETSLVQNVDGATSFLNEVQRRFDFEKLKETDSGMYSGIVDTVYASFKKGFILSNWIEGDEIVKYDKNIFDEIFKNLTYMEYAGIFEYDMINGNLLLTSDKKVIMYDFGYTYTFNPLTEYNPDGLEADIFHSAERFETRCFMQHLMDIEEEIGLEKALSLYSCEKEIAIKWYKIKLDWLKKNQANDYIISRIENYIKLWENGLKNRKDLTRLYNLESFRSYLLDVHDDISGKSCNPDTFKKIEKVILFTTENYDFIKSNNGFFWGDEKLTKNQLLEKYGKYKKEVIEYQLKDLDGFNQWRERRINNIKN